MSRAALAGAMQIPVDLIDVDAVKAALTFEYKPMGVDEPLILEHYREVGGCLHVPRQYGIDLCYREGIDYTDETSHGRPVQFPRVPTPRDYQIDALQSISNAFDSYYDFIFRARTGWGKTIGSLIIAAELGVSTLVVVDQENLKEQWIESLIKHFGFKREDIGIIQGAKCDYEGKAVTIAMVQTSTRKELPEAVYHAFGFVIVDEVHVIGAPTFSSILLRFSAAYRMGVSATPKRRDGLQKVLDYNLGRVRVYVDDEHDPSAVYVAEHPTVYSAYANTSPKIGRFVNEVTDDGSRNLLIAEAAAYLYDTGRDILVLSDRIEQLRQLMDLCYYLGIPEDEMGLYTGYVPRYEYAKDPKPLRRPAGLVKGCDYTPTSLQLISKRRKQKDLDLIKTSARIIFATYGKFSKGVDEPRLNGGIDASPRSLSEQVQGRILRKVEGKLKPIWITIADTSSYRSVFMLTKRLEDYERNNSVVSRWSLEKGKEPCNALDLKAELFGEVRRLKSMRIGTNSAGLNMLLMSTPPKTRGPQPRPVTRRTNGHASRTVC